MTELKSGMLLNEGEDLVIELEAEMWITGSNPIQRLMAYIYKYMAMLFGVKKEGYVVITNKRVVEVVRSKIFFIMDNGKIIRYLMPNSIKEVGYTKEPTFFCFCPVYQLFYDAITQRTSIRLKGMDEAEVQRIVHSFYTALHTAE